MYHSLLLTAAALRDGFLPSGFVEGSSCDAERCDPMDGNWGELFFPAPPAHLTPLSREGHYPSSPKSSEPANPASRPPSPDFGMLKGT